MQNKAEQTKKDKGHLIVVKLLLNQVVAEPFLFFFVWDWTGFL